MKNILKMIIPMSLATLINVVLSFTDTAMVGKLGVNAISAVASANALLSIFLQMISVIIIGFQIYASQYWREQQLYEINIYFKYTLVYMYGLALCCLLISVLFPNQLLSLFTTPEILSDSKSYLFARLASLIIFPLVICLKASFDIRRMMKIGLYSSMIIMLANILLNYVFIFICHLGVLGAGIASTLSVVLSMIYLFIQNKSQGIIIWAYFNKISLKNRQIHTELNSINLSETVNMLLDYLGGSVLFIMLSYMGIYAIAIGKITNLYINMIFSLILPLGTVIQILFNQSQQSEQRQYLKDMIKLVSIVMLPVILVMLIYPYIFARPFTDDVHLLNILSSAMQLLAISIVFMVFTVITTGLLRAYKRNKENMYINIFCIWLIQLPIAYLCSFKLNYGALGFIWSYVIYFIIRSLLNFYYMRKGDKFEKVSD